METIRSLVRPFIAVAFVLMCGWLTYKGDAGVKEIFSIMGIVIAFYFQERGMMKAIDKLKGE